LAGQGWVTSDSFEGMRALLVPQEKRVPFADLERKRRHKSVTSIEYAGRWSLLRSCNAGETPVAASNIKLGEKASNGLLSPALSSIGGEGVPDAAGGAPASLAAIETFARALLRRYGVVFRRLIE